MVEKISLNLLSSWGLLLLSICLVKGLVTDIGSKRYVIQADRSVNWYQANRACTGLGMSLTSIDSEEEYTNLSKYLSEQGLSLQDYWLSGTNWINSSSNVYTWISSGRKLYYTKWQTGEPKSNDDSNDNTDSQTNDEDANGESTSNEESNAESNVESNAESTDDSNDDSSTESKARCIVTDSEFKWITVECATETKYYICSRPLVPNCGINGRCKINNAFLLPLHD